MTTISSPFFLQALTIDCYCDLRLDRDSISVS
jgi:hypothetical protein